MQMQCVQRRINRFGKLHLSLNCKGRKLEIRRGAIHFSRALRVRKAAACARMIQPEGT